MDRSQGSTSLKDGALELMVHRRMAHDDHRGVSEALNEPGLDGRGLVIRGRHWLTLAPEASAPPLYKAQLLRSLALPVSVLGFSPLGASLDPLTWRGKYNASASLLSAQLPANLHLVTVHLLNASRLLLRLAHIYEVGEHPLLAVDASVDLATLFARGLTVVTAQDFTLPGGSPLGSVVSTVFTTDGGDVYTVPVQPTPPSGGALTVTLHPMEIRTFMCTVVWEG